MFYDAVIFVLLSALVLALGLATVRRAQLTTLPRLILLGLTLRIVGALARYGMVAVLYGGRGDSYAYFNIGKAYADGIRTLRLTPVSLAYWTEHSKWWSTHFVEHVTGIVLAFIGPSMMGAFLLYSLCAFVGLCLIGKAFQRESGSVSGGNAYVQFLWCWPSLWFWPSSIGKEAVILLAVGICCFAYRGSEGRPNWPLFGAGLFLSFAIRPHIAAIVALSAAVAHWLSSFSRLTARRSIELVAITGVGLFMVARMSQAFGFEELNVDSLIEFYEFSAGQTLQGGSNVGGVPALGPVGLPFAFANVWMRPFIWEAHNLPALFSAFELVVFWWLAWQRRAGLRLLLVQWRRSRLLCFAVPFLIAYTVLIGMTFGNLGIIARQRTPAFPFLLMVLAAAPVPATAAAARPAALPGNGSQPVTA